jgi:hypothetical protein
MSLMKNVKSKGRTRDTVGHIGGMHANRNSRN